MLSRAIVDRDEVSSLKLKWQHACAIFVVGYRPSLPMFVSFVKTKWPGLEHNFSVILHNDGYFLVKCNSEEDVMMLVNGGNTMIGKRPVLIKKWDDKFNRKLTHW